MSFGCLDSVYVVIRESDGSWKFTGEAESSADLSAVVQLSDSCRARGADRRKRTTEKMTVITMKDITALP